MQSKLFGHPVDIERSKFTYNLCRNSMSDYKNISEWTMRGYRTFRQGKEGGPGSTKKILFLNLFYIGVQWFYLKEDYNFPSFQERPTFSRAGGPTTYSYRNLQKL